MKKQTLHIGEQGHLSDLKIGQVAKVLALHSDNKALRRRLLDLGLVHGTNIKAVFKSPIGNPIAYEIRGTTIALRKEDSKLIDVGIL